MSLFERSVVIQLSKVGIRVDAGIVAIFPHNSNGVPSYLLHTFHNGCRRHLVRRDHLQTIVFRAAALAYRTRAQAPDPF